MERTWREVYYMLLIRLAPLYNLFVKDGEGRWYQHSQWNMCDFRDRGPVGQNLSLIFELITTPARQQSSKDVPIDSTEEQAITGQRIVLLRMSVAYIAMPTRAYAAPPMMPFDFCTSLGKKGASNKATAIHTRTRTPGIHAL